MGEVAALAAASLWAVASAVFTRAGRAVPPLTLNLLKTAIGLFLLALTLLLLDGRLWPAVLSGRDLGWLGVSGLIGLTLGDSAYFQALQRIGPRRALLLWALIPPLTAVAAVPVLGEPLTPWMGVGILVTVGGVTWVMRERTADHRGRTDLLGVAYGLVAVLCQAGGSLTAKLGGRDLDALELSVVRLAAGTAGLLLAVAFRPRPMVAVLKRPADMMQITLGTFLGTFLGIWLSMLALQTIPAGIAATLTSTSPLFVLPVARFWLGETVTPRAVMGATIAVTGIAILLVRAGQ